MTKIYNFDSNICSDYKIEWENEVLTEYKSYLHINNSNNNLPLSYLAYPWALLIDYYHNNNKKSFFDFLDSLGLVENLRNKNDYSITVIQSYHFKKYLPDFKKLGIKYIFSPHITKKDFLDIFYNFDIIVYPYYIFPSIVSKENNPIGKHILYSFIGNVNYSLQRPTIVRNNLVNMKHVKNTHVKKLDEWHFNKAIYSNQLNIIKTELSKSQIIEQKIKREKDYRRIMETSLFSLCPLGIGPNSIRLWESFTYNTIPVSISDDLWLPFYLDVNWNDIMISIKENNYQDILKLNQINSKIISEFQNQIESFSKIYLEKDNFGSIIYNVYKPKNEVTLLVPWYNQDKESLRYQEIHQCLEINLKNKYIKSIVFFYEVENKDDIRFEDYNNPKIKIIPVITNKKRDITFNRLARYANENLLNELCIISNNDIYFDETLSSLSKLDFYKNNYFISLTRKNYGKYLDNRNKIWKPHSASQDSWIFTTPIKLMENEINLGWIQCDNIISAAYDSLGYHVINPHYSINAWHVHMYNNTNELLKKFNYQYKYKMKKIELEYIEDILSSDNKNIFQLEKENITIPEITKPNRINVSKLANLKKKWILKESSN